jgi:type IV secretory pathway VirB4 component
MNSRKVRFYRITTTQKITKICEGKIADFIIKLNPDKIYLYYDNKELTDTFLLSFFPWNKSYKELYTRFMQDS